MLFWKKKKVTLSLCIRFFTSMLLTFLMFFEVCGAAVALLTPSQMQLGGLHRFWVHLQQLFPPQGDWRRFGNHSGRSMQCGWVFLLGSSTACKYFSYKYCFRYLKWGLKCWEITHKNWERGMQIASVLVFADIKFGGRRMGVFCVTLIDEPGLGVWMGLGFPEHWGTLWWGPVRTWIFTEGDKAQPCKTVHSLQSFSGPWAEPGKVDVTGVARLGHAQRSSCWECHTVLSKPSRQFCNPFPKTEF